MATSGRPEARPSIKSAISRTSKWSVGELAEPILLTIPPDGGWGWVVCIASFAINFIVDGTMYCFAVFLPEISKDIGVEETKVALISSLLSGFYYSLGPLNCAACNRFGFRAVGITGGIFAAGAFLCASFLNGLVPLLLVVGVWGGLAFNLIYTPAAIAVGFYFERWRALALSFVVCGTAAGMVAYPPLVTRLFAHLSWRRKFQIISGLCVFCGLLALVYRPIKAKKAMPQRVQFGDEAEVFSIVSEETGFFSAFKKFKNKFFPTISEISLDNSSLISTAKTSRMGSKTTLKNLPMRRDTPDTTSMYMGVDIGSVKNALYTLEERSEEDLPSRRCCAYCRRRHHHKQPKIKKKCCRFKSRCCKREKKSVEDKDDDIFSLGNRSTINRPMYRDDIFYQGSIRTIASNRTTFSTTSRMTTREAVAGAGGPSIAYTLSVTRAATQKDLAEEGKCKCCPESCLRTLATMLDLELFKSVAFMMLAVSGCLSLMGMYIPLVYVAKRATDEYEIERKTAVLLISIIGISNLVGRICCTFVTYIPKVDVTIMSYGSLIFCGLITVASSFLKTFVLQAFFCGTFGFTIAGFSGLRSVVFVDLFGLENLTSCFGINMLFQSLASFLGVPIANALYNATGDFIFTFSFSGGVIILSGVMLIPIKRVQRWQENRLR